MDHGGAARRLFRGGTQGRCDRRDAGPGRLTIPPGSHVPARATARVPRDSRRHPREDGSAAGRGPRDLEEGPRRRRRDHLARPAHGVSRAGFARPSRSSRTASRSTPAMPGSIATEGIATSRCASSTARSPIARRPPPSSKAGPTRSNQTGSRTRATSRRARCSRTPGTTWPSPATSKASSPARRRPGRARATWAGPPTTWSRRATGLLPLAAAGRPGRGRRGGPHAHSRGSGRDRERQLPLAAAYVQRRTDARGRARSAPEGAGGSAVRYGVGAWFLVNGKTADATRLFRSITSQSDWPSFGFIAAEAELARALTHFHYPFPLPIPDVSAISRLPIPRLPLRLR